MEKVKVCLSFKDVVKQWKRCHLDEQERQRLCLSVKLVSPESGGTQEAHKPPACPKF
jgi:hypothetical protein